MAHYVALLYVCQFGGLLMIAGGMTLIYKQKIDINRVTKTMEITVPFFGKLRTNTPALALFALGFIPLLYPLQKLKTEYLHVQQDINSNVHPVLVYAVVNSKPIPSGVGHLDLPIPVLSTEDYSPALVYVAGDVTDSQELDLKNLKKGLITLDHKTILGHNVEVKSDVVPPPDNFKR